MAAPRKRTCSGRQFASSLDDFKTAFVLATLHRPLFWSSHKVVVVQQEEVNQRSVGADYLSPSGSESAKVLRLEKQIDRKRERKSRANVR